MKLPKRINISGHFYSIKRVKPDAIPGAVGVCQWPERQILLSTEIDGQMLFTTLLHEIRHAWQFESGFTQILHPQSLEVDADSFASLITSIFTVKFKVQR